MDDSLRHPAHWNLYYIFLLDQTQNPMPEAKLLELYQLIQNLINEEGEIP